MGKIDEEDVHLKEDNKTTEQDDLEGQEQDDGMEGRGQDDGMEGQEQDNGMEGQEQDDGMEGRGQDDGQKKPLATISKHQHVRQKANEAYLKNAQKMQRKHAKNAKIHVFTVGEYASVRIPRIDRTATDLQRLPCIIVEVIGKAQSMYRLRCKHGVISTCFHAGDLEPFSGTYNIPVEGWQDETRITLREAARQQSPWNSFTKNRCNCKPGTCDTRRCYCKKRGIECSTHCHKGEACNNKPGSVQKIAKCKEGVGCGGIQQPEGAFY